jgi:uncharacterized membrane protein YbhN (UPF0104 family)
VVVLVMVGREVLRTLQRISLHGDLPHLEPGWLIASVGFYVAGLSAFGMWFWRILDSSPSPVRAWAAVRAYLISHLGKYVPGKALVVVMRVGLVTGYGARPATAAFSTLYETLVMMASGGLVAAVGFAMGPTRTLSVPVWGVGEVVLPLSLLGLAPALGFLALTWPTVFPRLSKVMSLPFPGVGPDALPTLRRRLLAEGLAWASLGWLLAGLSLAAVVMGLDSSGKSLPLSSLPIIIASVALATVSGFVVAVAPGGLGVREWVLWTALGSVMDHERAVLASLALRLVWIVGEGLAAAVVGILRPRLRPSEE